MNALSAKLARLIDFFANGIAADPKHYDPADVASEMAALEAVLQDGIQSKHLAGGSLTADKIAANAVTADKIADEAVSGAKLAANMFRLLPFAGVDGSGEEPDLTCTLTGALEDDLVVAILDTSDFSDARANFESSIAVDDAIEQVELADLSAKTFLALLIAA
jgi:hypothetical protein